MEAPEGFEFIKWKDVVEGQVVWLWMQVRKKIQDENLEVIGEDLVPEAAGPYYVHNKQLRQLVTRYGTLFMHYPEELMVRRFEFHQEVPENADIYP